MSGILVGELILWLIVAIIAIVIVVYIVNWLYHRSSKEVSFVRTGFLGERVVINGGAFVLPFIHDYTPVNMNVLPMGITRARQDAVITRDRMRVDIEADFYVRVQATREAVAIAAATLGRRTLEPEQLHALLSGKFVSAIRSVAAEMTMEQMHEQRGEYVARVKAAAAEALAQNGLELESVAITDLDQTDLEYFNPSNRFDAEGLTRLMEDIEAKRKLRNDIEQELDDQDPHPQSRCRAAGARDRARERDRPARAGARHRDAPRAAAHRSGARARAARDRGRAGAVHRARGDREGAHRQRAGDRRGPYRLRARDPPARDRAHARGRGKGAAGPRGDRKGADRQPARGRHRPDRLRDARCASATSSARARSRKPRSRRARRSRRRASSRTAPSPMRASPTRRRRGGARSSAPARSRKPRSRRARRRRRPASPRP